MNMLRPATADLLGANDNRYSLVIATAKIAREISEEAQEKKIPLEDKPVSLAVDLISKNRYKISPPVIENTDFVAIAKAAELAAQQEQAEETEQVEEQPEPTEE